MSDESKIVKSDFSGLDKFVKAISTNMIVKVGIFGAKNPRRDQKGTLTNAEVGFIHEFGTDKIPKRSFLRMPLFLYGDDILAMVKKSGAAKKLAAGKGVQVLADLGIACENVILRAFDSGGWGDWAPNAPSTIRRKSKKGRRSDSPLIDTGQLRRSIASAVVNP